MRSTDGKSLIGPIEAINKINAVDIANVAEIISKLCWIPFCGNTSF